MMNRHFKAISLLCLAFSIPVVAKAEPPNLGVLKNEVQAYHDSGVYQKELDLVINRAHHYIVSRAEHNNSHEKLAIVLDIDETSLSNYHALITSNFSTSNEQWQRFIRAANAPAIHGMLALYNDAKKHQVSVFFVTARNESQREATIKNLKKAGYTDWNGLYLKPNHDKQPSNIPFKSSARAKIQHKGFTIIACIGDQSSDCKGENAGRVFKLPNPYYIVP